jgi:hypothetical protein
LFKNSTGVLESVYIPEGVENIDEDAFIGIALTSCQFPKSLREIRTGAFCNTNIIEINFDTPNVETEE